MKIFWTVLSVLCGFLIISCSDDEVTPDKVELSTVIRQTEFLDKYSLQHITSSVELKEAEFALLTYIKTDNNINNHISQPAITSGALAIPLDNLNTVSAILENDSLKQTSPLIYPGFFFTPNSWSLDKHNYNAENLWQISYQDSFYEIPTKLQSSVYRVLLNVKDTVDLKQNLTITWSRALVPNSNDKVYVSFKWYPSFSDAKYYQDYPGFESTDTGIYTLSAQDIQAYKFPEYGVLQVNVIRYNKELVQVLGKKFFVANISASYSSAYIRR